MTAYGRIIRDLLFEDLGSGIFINPQTPSLDQCTISDTMRFEGTFLVILSSLVSLHALSLRSSDRHGLPSLRAATNAEQGSIRSRRDVLVQTGGIALSTLLTGGRPIPAAAVGEGEPQTIAITGANSGIGFEACKRLAAQGHNLVLACRTVEKARDTATRLEEYRAGGTLIPAECNLASLKSIDSFAGELKSLVGNIDVLCLNAGLARNTAAKDVARTEDGFELTVGTNHFGHFYLNQLVLPMVKSNGGKIVVTASGVHDPESPGGAQGVPATLGDLAGLEKEGRSCEMIDGSPFNADKAYKDSKLCNVLFTRELQRRLESNESTKGICANCFNPGLIVGTGLFKDQNPVFTKLFDLAATDLLKVGETPSFGGGCLAYMVNQVNTKGKYYTSPPGSVKYGDTAYGKQFTVENVSKEAQDDAKAKRLWELSCQVLGVPA